MPYTECQPSREIFGRISICTEHNRPVSDCVIASLQAEIKQLNAAFNNAMNRRCKACSSPSCHICLRYDELMEADPHFYVQHHQGKTAHQLYGVCFDRNQRHT